MLYEMRQPVRISCGSAQCHQRVSPHEASKIRGYHDEQMYLNSLVPLTAAMGSSFGSAREYVDVTQVSHPGDPTSDQAFIYAQHFCFAWFCDIEGDLKLPGTSNCIPESPCHSEKKCWISTVQAPLHILRDTHKKISNENPSRAPNEKS